MKPAPQRSHDVRVIGGQWKRSKLPVLNRPGLRPSPDRVRETLFNWLGGDLTGWRCVDAFAGSGALGFEAASRGAQEVLLLERDPALVANLRAQKERFGATAIRVEADDARVWLRAGRKDGWDLILLDPPFDADWALAALADASMLLVPGGLLYYEAAQTPVEWPAGLSLHRSARAGAVHFHLLQRDV